MKLRNVLLILLTVLIIVKIASADQESDLIGLGMPAPLATKVANPEDLDVTNNVTIGGTLGVTGVSTFTGEADFNGGIDGGFTDGSILFSDSNGEISEDVAGLSFNSSSNVLTATGGLRLSAAGSFLYANVATVAPAGSNQGDATPLVQSFNYSGTSDGTKGFILPTPTANFLPVIFVNVASAGTTELYPHSGGAINDQATNAGVTMSGGSGTLCYPTDTTNWNCFEFAETTL